jgi:hypothetical protein
MSPSGTLDPSADLIEEHCRVGIPELALSFVCSREESIMNFQKFLYQASQSLAR